MKPTRERRDERITIRLPATLRKKLEREARAQQRSLGDTIVQVLLAHVARGGDR